MFTVCHVMRCDILKSGNIILLKEVSMNIVLSIYAIVITVLFIASLDA